MAKRQELAEFNPVRRIEPAQQITDNFYAPQQFQAPRHPLEDIGAALGQFSQTLTDAYQQYKGVTDEEATADVADMTEEELRAAIVGDWRRSGLPDGGDPISQISIREAAARRMVRDVLGGTLQENVARFSDPYNTDDPREFALEQFESLGIQGEYARRAAKGSYDSIAQAFVVQVNQARNAATAAQRREDVQDDLYYHLNRYRSTMSPEDQDQIIENAKAVLDAGHSQWNESFRDQMWGALSAAAQNIAVDTGDAEAARSLLQRAAEIKIGSTTVGHQFRAEMDRLEDGLDELAERSVLNADRVEERRRKKDEHTARRITNAYIHNNRASLDPDNLGVLEAQLRASDILEADITTYLNQGRDQIVAYLHRDKPDAVSDPAVKGGLAAAIEAAARGNPTISEDELNQQIQRALDDGELVPLDAYGLLIKSGIAYDASDQSDEIRSRTRSDQDAGWKSIQRELYRIAPTLGAAFGEGEYTTEFSREISRLEDEYNRQAREIVDIAVAEGAESNLPKEKIEENVRQRLQKLRDEMIHALDPETMPADDPLRQVGTRDRTLDPASALIGDLPGPSVWSNDSNLITVLDSNREGLKSMVPEVRARSLRALQDAARQRLDEVLGRTDVLSDWWATASFADVRRYVVKDGQIQMHIQDNWRGHLKETFTPYPNVTNEDWAARSLGVEPVSPEELEASQKSGRSKHGVDMHPDADNPQRFLYFRSLEALEAARVMYEDSENKDETFIGRYLKLMPGMDFDTFYYYQHALLGASKTSASPSTPPTTDVGDPPNLGGL